MFRVKIKLIVCSLDIDKENEQINIVILSQEKNNFVLPEINLDPGECIINQHKKYFKEYIGLEYDWVEHKLLDLEQDGDIINIYYSVNIPIETKINNGFFISSNKCNYNKIVQKAIRYM